ncbi:MAG TPA: outer membrane beta-barrel protein [Chitinophagales bacterium]|nr:outer membrane beta-barrel protein [Chitinophagales bacterium]
MKKHFLATLLFFTILNFAHAQEFVLSLNGGYAWPGIGTPENVMGPKIDPYSPETDGLINLANLNDSIKLNKPVHGSYGKGGNLTFSFGYLINPYFGVGLGISYLHSASVTCDQIRQLTGPGSALPSVQTNYYLNANISTNAYGLSIMPSVTINGCKPGWKVYPYARVGITLPVWGKVIHNVHISADSAFAKALLDKAPYFLGHNTDVRLETESTISVGINGAVGVCYRPIPLISVFAEINGQYLNVRAKSATITKWDADGVDQIPARGVYRTQFNFVDKLTGESNNAEYNSNYDASKPKDDTRPVAPFSNIGFNVGVNFYLSKTILQAKKKKPTQKA